MRRKRLSENGHKSSAQKFLDKILRLKNLVACGGIISLSFLAIAIIAQEDAPDKSLDTPQTNASSAPEPEEKVQDNINSQVQEITIPPQVDQKKEEDLETEPLPETLEPLPETKPDHDEEAQREKQYEAEERILELTEELEKEQKKQLIPDINQTIEQIFLVLSEKDQGRIIEIPEIKKIIMIALQYPSTSQTLIYNVSQSNIGVKSLFLGSSTVISAKLDEKINEYSSRLDRLLQNPNVDNTTHQRFLNRLQELNRQAQVLHELQNM